MPAQPKNCHIMVRTSVVDFAVYTRWFTWPWDSTLGLIYTGLHWQASGSSGEYSCVRETTSLDRPHIWLQVSSIWTGTVK